MVFPHWTSQFAHLENGRDGPTLPSSQGVGALRRCASLSCFVWLRLTCRQGPQAARRSGQVGGTYGHLHGHLLDRVQQEAENHLPTLSLMPRGPDPTPKQAPLIKSI